MNAFLDELEMIKSAGIPSAFRRSPMFGMPLSDLLMIAKNPELGAKQTQAARILANRAGRLPGANKSPIGMRAKKLSQYHLGGPGTRFGTPGFGRAVPGESIPKPGGGFKNRKPISRAIERGYLG